MCVIVLCFAAPVYRPILTQTYKSATSKLYLRNKLLVCQLYTKFNIVDMKFINGFKNC